MDGNKDDSHKYGDMLYLPHHVSKTHPQMSLHDRAAQFSPFAALTGYEAKIKESGRLTDQRVELDEYEISLLDEKLQRINEKAADKPRVTIVYFQPDRTKEGGAYLTVTGNVKKIDSFAHQLIFCDGMTIDINQIYRISGV